MTESLYRCIQSKRIAAPAVVARNRAGSMLAVVSLAGGLILVLAGCALSIVGLLAVQCQLKSLADRVTLSAVRQLNDDNKIGKMNNLEIRCRQLVYTSRHALLSAQTTAPIVSGLADELLKEARTDAQELSEEHDSLLALSHRQVHEAITREFESVRKQSLSLPWVSVAEPCITVIKTGKVKGVNSDVSLLEGIPELNTYDQSSKHLESASNLYVPGTIPLPVNDTDLKFNVSSLPPPENGQALQARLMLPESVDANDSKLFDSAITVEISADVSSCGHANPRALTVRSAATTFGGDDTFE